MGRKGPYNHVQDKELEGRAGQLRTLVKAKKITAFYSKWAPFCDTGGFWFETRSTIKRLKKLKLFGLKVSDKELPPEPREPHPDLDAAGNSEPDKKAVSQQKSSREQFPSKEPPMSAQQTAEEGQAWPEIAKTTEVKISSDDQLRKKRGREPSAKVKKRSEIVATTYRARVIGRTERNWKHWLRT